MEWVNEDKTALALLRLVDLVLTLVFRGVKAAPSREPRFLGEESLGREAKDLTTIEAIRNNNMGGLQEAVLAGADVNAADQFGQTVLVWAAYTGTLEMAELLMQHNADPNLGRSPPLHYAARFGRADMVQLLLKYGADPLLSDAEGKTALEQARHARGGGKEGRHEEVVKILEAALRARSSSSSASPLGIHGAAEEETCAEPPDEEQALRCGSRVLPMLVRAYEGAVQATVRKGSLALISRLIALCSPSLLHRLVSRSSYDSQSAPSSRTASPSKMSPTKSPARLRKAQTYCVREFSQVSARFFVRQSPMACVNCAAPQQFPNTSEPDEQDRGASVRAVC